MMTKKQGVEVGVGITLGQHCTTQISRGPKYAVYGILHFLIVTLRKVKRN